MKKNTYRRGGAVRGRLNKQIQNLWGGGKVTPLEDLIGEQARYLKPSGYAKPYDMTITPLTRGLNWIKEDIESYVGPQVGFGKWKVDAFDALRGTLSEGIDTLNKHLGPTPTAEEANVELKFILGEMNNPLLPGKLKDSMIDTIGTGYRQQFGTKIPYSVIADLDTEQQQHLIATGDIASAGGGSLLGASNPAKRWINKGASQAALRAANRMSWKAAFATENPLSRHYKGFKTGYAGPNKVGLGKYALEGTKSLAGKKAVGNIGGGTPFLRKVIQSPIINQASGRTLSLLSKVSPWIQGLMPGAAHAPDLTEEQRAEWGAEMNKQLAQLTRQDKARLQEEWDNMPQYVPPVESPGFLNRAGSYLYDVTHRDESASLLNRNSIAEGSAVNKKERRTKRIATAEKERREIEQYEAAQAAAAAEQESIDRGNEAVEQAGGSMDDFSDIPTPTSSRPSSPTYKGGRSSRGNRWGPSSHMI